MRRLIFRPIVGLMLLALLVIGLGPFQAPIFSAAGLPDIRAACQTDKPYVVATCFRGILRAEASRPFDARAPSVLVLQDTEQSYPHYELANFEEVGAVWGLAYSAREHAIYTSAYHKRQLPFGPAGPGGIYRISLSDGALTTFATVPNAGSSMHDVNISGHDNAGKPWAGKTSLGDLDLNEDESELFVMNLNDRRIYRYDVATADLIGTIPNGASNERWAEDARPFALESHGGVLYHGVINSAELARNRELLAAYLYRSAPDGSDMTEVARIDLNYSRGTVHIGSNTATAGLDWQYWKTNHTNDLRPGFSFVIYPMPMLTDIEIDDDGVSHNLGHGGLSEGPTTSVRA